MRCWRGSSGRHGYQGIIAGLTSFVRQASRNARSAFCYAGGVHVVSEGTRSIWGMRVELDPQVGVEGKWGKRSLLRGVSPLRLLLNLPLGHVESRNGTIV